MKTKTVLLPLTSSEIELLSETLEMEIQIEEDNGNVKQLVRHYKKIDKKLGCSNRFTQDEIGTICNLSEEQYNHFYDTHEKLANDYQTLYKKVYTLDWKTWRKFLKMPSTDILAPRPYFYEEESK
jgi:hypothetical protein